MRFSQTTWLPLRNVFFKGFDRCLKFWTAKPFPLTISRVLTHFQDTEESEQDDLKSLMSGVYAKDWVNDFVEPDESVVEEGRKTIDFLLKRYSASSTRTT